MGRYVRLPARGLAVVAVVASTLLLAPGALAGNLYVSNANSGTVSPFSIGAGGALTPIICTECGTNLGPQGVAIRPDGKFRPNRVRQRPPTRPDDTEDRN